jgi:hypothetical protein
MVKWKGVARLEFLLLLLYILAIKAQVLNKIQPLLHNVY